MAGAGNNIVAAVQGPNGTYQIGGSRFAFPSNSDFYPTTYQVTDYGATLAAPSIPTSILNPGVPGSAGTTTTGNLLGNISNGSALNPKNSPILLIVVFLVLGFLYLQKVIWKESKSEKKSEK